MSIKGAVVTVKCDGRDGGCRNYLEFNLEQYDTGWVPSDPIEIGELVNKEGWSVIWDKDLHFCPNHHEDYWPAKERSNILPFPSREFIPGRVVESEPEKLRLGWIE